MEGDGYRDDGLDPLFPATGGASFSQAGSGAGIQGLDLNSQADDFPYISNYQAFLEGGAGGMDSGLPPGRGNRFLGVHRRDGGWNERGRGGGMRGRQLDFEGGGGRAGSMAAPAGGAFLGGSSSGQAGHGRGIPPSGAGGGRRRTSSQRGHGRASNHGGRSRGRGLQRGNSQNIEDDEAEDENEIEEVPQVNPKKTDKAIWSDQNTTILLQLCLQQVEAGNYGDGNMNTPGYNTIIMKYKQSTGLMHDRKQIKTRIAQLRQMYNFWSMLQTHTGLGRNPDGSIAADATFWKDHTEDEESSEEYPSENGQEGEPPYENDEYSSEDGHEDEPLYENDEYPSENGSSSEAEIVKRARSSLKRDHEFIMQTMAVFGTYFQTYYIKKPKRVAKESGIEWVERTLADEEDCYDMFRVSRPVFNKIHNLLVSKYELKSSTKMSSVEALAMFLWVVGAPQSVRQAKNRLVRSLETVSRNFNRVLSSVLKLGEDIIRPKDPHFSTVHPTLENPFFWPHFNNCIGAIDGTHVKLVVEKSKVVPHMCRHKYTSQNVLAVCDFDMRFTFILAGWPGSVHDMTVFKDATRRYADKFPHPPPGKFYCVDAGYPNRPGYLSPYRGIKYPHAPFQNVPPPKGKKETFNHAHSKVRNVVERSFGVLKMKFRILLQMPKFSPAKQARIIVACMALHNFIRQSKMSDRDFDLCDADENYVPLAEEYDSDDEPNTQQGPLDEDMDMNDFRDQIADALFHK